MSGVLVGNDQNLKVRQRLVTQFLDFVSITTVSHTSCHGYAMDEDFGTSIWATTTPAIAPLSSPTFPQSPFTVNQLDEVDGFGAQKDVSGNDDDDDDFGDFGEFGQAEDTTEEIGDSGHFSEPAVSVAGPSSWDWEPLHLDPLPSRHALEAQIEEILGPLWNTDDTSLALTDEDVREVGGLAQILVTPDR